MSFNPIPLHFNQWAIWQYRAPITITEQSGSDLSCYQVRLTIDTASLIAAGKLKSDCSDLRFTDANGKMLVHWLDTENSQCNSANTVVWVKVPSLLASSDAVLYMYYGNAVASSVSDGSAVFLFFDDFNDGVYDDKWEIGSDNLATESGGYIHLYDSGGDYGNIIAKNFNLTGQPIVIEDRKRGSGYGNFVWISAGSYYFEDAVRFEDCAYWGGGGHRIQIFGPSLAYIPTVQARISILHGCTIKV